MSQTCFISRTGAPDLRLKPKKKGGVAAAYAVYTNAPTQPQFAQAHGLCITRGQQKTHGVRTNG